MSVLMEKYSDGNDPLELPATLPKGEKPDIEDFE
jgi:hypothetical protein